MAPSGSIATKWVLTATLLLASPNSPAAVAVGDNGNSHESTWKVADVGLYMDPSLLELPGANEALLDAADTWKDADPRLPHVWPIVGKADDLGYRQGQRNRNTIRYAADGEPRAKGALAITLVTYDSEQMAILDADIVINGVYTFDDNGKYCGQRKSAGDCNAYDLGDVLAHEFGHWLGLPDDTEDPTSIMYPYFDPGVTRRKSLGEGDRQALDDLYAHDTSPAGKTPACSVATQPGRTGAPLTFCLFFAALGASCWRRSRSAARRSLTVARGPQRAQTVKFTQLSRQTFSKSTNGRFS